MEAYKCFNKGLINRYGTKFEVGKLYKVSGKIKFGNSGNGFHSCSYLEDTLRYFDTFSNNVDIALIDGFGNSIIYNDEYNGFYDMYVFEKMIINKVLTRDEIINYGLNLYDFRLKRFLSLYKLDYFEKKMFYDKYKNNNDILNYIEYYQNNKKDVFIKKIKK